MLAVDVFPSAGTSAMFSNAAFHTIAVRRVNVTGVGDAAAFKAGAEEYRFACRFDTLERITGQPQPIQRATLVCPDGQALRLVVNDENGADDPGRCVSGLRRTAFRSVLSCVDASNHEEDSEPAGARQRALHRRRIRYAPRARPQQRHHCSVSLPRRARCRRRAASSDKTRRVTIGSADRNRPTCGSTIPRSRARMICATCGTSRPRSRSPKTSVRCSTSA